MAMRTPAVLTLVLLFLVPPVQPAQPAAEWASIVADWEAFERREDPYAAGGEGDREALMRLPEITPEADARRLAALKVFQTRLAGFDTGALAADDAFNHAFRLREIGAGGQVEQLAAVAAPGGPGDLPLRQHNC